MKLGQGHDRMCAKTLVRRLTHGKIQRALCLEAAEHIKELEGLVSDLECDVYFWETKAKKLQEQALKEHTP